MTTTKSLAATLATLRHLLLAVLVFGLVGTTIDLLLIGHDEDTFQLIPLAAIGLSLFATVALALTARGGRAAGSTALFRAAMAILVVTGAAGSVLHYRASMEFKLEMDPSLSGRALFFSVVQSQTPPAMAPATLVLLGLLGLVAVYRRTDDPRVGTS